MLFAYTGAAIILYGGVLTVTRTLQFELKRSIELSFHDIRRDFTHKIVFGLDFLGATVSIRTVMGYFLTKEAAEFDSSRKEVG